MAVSEMKRRPGRPRNFDEKYGVELALGMFHARGYDAVRVADVNEVLGIQAPSFYAAAGAAGLMTAREFGRAGRKVTVLEARDRCGGRIHPLPAAEFGYPAEGGAEFVHGEAPVTHGLLCEAGPADPGNAMDSGGRKILAGGISRSS